MDKVTIPECNQGDWSVSHFSTNTTDFHSLLSGRNVPIGETYTRLMRNGHLVMSDTPAEMSDCRIAVRMARGSCLINGLGLGMVLQAILQKDVVDDVTVVEISQDLIDLISPHYSDTRLNIVCANAFDYKPPQGKRFDMVWHDIWDNICSDNLPQMTRLHRKYGCRADWQDSWCKGRCKQS